MKLEKIVSGTFNVARKAVLPLVAMAAMHATPAKAQTIVPTTTYTVVNEPITGIASTPTYVYGATGTGLYTSDPLLSTTTGPTSFGASVSDLGSWNSSYMLSLNSTGSIDKISLSSLFSVGSTTAANAGAISSVFNYQGVDSFVVYDTADSNLKVYNWGNSTPVATLFNAGAGVNGLDIRVSNTSGVVNNLSTDLQIFTTKTGENTFNYQTASGDLLGHFSINGVSGFEDLGYRNNTLALGINDSGFQGGIMNVDMSGLQTAAVSEPATYALLAGGLAIASAAYMRRRMNSKEVVCEPDQNGVYTPVNNPKN